jgi:Gamma tubulin complex component C-terminal
VERDVALMIFEMGSGLRLLWRVKPDHPLCDVFDSRMASEGLELRWLLSWDDIHDSHEHLDSYAEKMDSLIATPRTTTTQPPSQPRSDDPTEFGLFDTKEEAEQMISQQVQQMSLLPQQSTPTPFLTDFHTLHNTLPTIFPPPLSLALQNSLHNALQTQSSLIQKSLVTLFLTDLNLQTHLSTLHRFLLFGDGCFVTRLHEALFEDFDSADGRAGGQTGLGLGIGLLVGRDVWPPSGGKTSVVLRNVLAQSGVDASEVSFGYREMSDDQFEKVKNPIGLHTLRR